MSRKQFEEFLSQKEEELEKLGHIDWQKQKDEWLQRLEELYGKFRDSLKDYVQKGSVRTKVYRVSVSEEYIGTYTAPILEIVIAGETIRLKPVGTNLIGAKGRVDMSGRKGSTILVLVDSSVRSGRDLRFTFDRSFPRHSPTRLEWRFVSPSKEYIPVNEDTIYSTIMDLI